MCWIVEESTSQWFDPVVGVTGAGASSLQAYQIRIAV
jgi:hypothetical protein